MGQPGEPANVDELNEQDADEFLEATPLRTGGSLPRTILGIDPGLNICGYGVLRQISPREVRLIEGGVVRGKSKKSLTLRLQEIYSGICEVIEALKPDEIALEQLYSHYERPRTAILMGHARGVICLASAQAGIPIHHYAATQVKKLLTGNGRAPKSQMQLAICKQLHLASPPEPPDVADALAIALCHAFLSRTL